MKKLFLLLFLIPCCGLVAAQDVRDNTIADLLENAQKYLEIDINKALYFANTALQKAQNEHNTLMVFQSYRKLGAILEDNNRLAEAKEYHAKALAMSDDKAVPSSQKLNILNEWAIINKKMGQYKIAQDYHFKCIEFARKVGDQEMVEFGYHGIGSMYSMMSDFDKAIHYYHLSMQVAESRGDKEGATITLQNIASIYLKAKNLDMAYSSADKALKMANELADSSRIAKVLRVFADIELAKGNNAEALRKNYVSYQIFQAKGDKRNLGETFLSIASNFYEQKQYEKAEDYFYQCQSLLPNLLPYGSASYYHKLGKLYVAKGEKKEAIKVFTQSLVLTDSLGFKEVASANHKALAEVYASQQDYQNAHQHAVLGSAIDEKLFAEVVQKDMTEAQFKYDVEKSDQEITALKAQKMKIYSFFGVAVLLSMIVFSIYNLRKNKELKAKNKEINEQNTRLETHNNGLLQVAYVAAHDLQEPLRSIGSFTNLIQRKYGHQFNDEAKEYMGFVVDNTQKMNKLFTGLLTYSSIVADDDYLEQTCDFNIVVSETLHLYSDLIKHTNASVTYDSDMPTLPIKYLHGLELVKNLLSNALKFSNVRPIVHIASNRSASNAIKITVSDNGTGILNIEKQKVFNLFHRSDRSEKNKGTGVGLAICKAIMDKYNGSIGFDSDQNGTVFSIIFPQNQ